MSSSECELCGATEARLEAHHVDYESDERVTVCRNCHETIHHTDEYPHLKPSDEQKADYYDPEVEVDKSELPSRPGWTIQIKMIPCAGEDCSNCPHGPYYYYYRREGDTVRTEYGGKVEPEMMVKQTELRAFA